MTSLPTLHMQPSSDLVTNIIFDDLESSIDSQIENPTANQDHFAARTLRISLEVAQGRKEIFAQKQHDQVSTQCDYTDHDEVIHKARKFIWTYSRGPISVSDVARKLLVNRRTLDRRFSETLGHTVLEEIIRCRMFRAKFLLITTEYPIKKVAYLAGFPSSERMRVSFVEREGCPPQIYRSKKLLNS